MKNGVGVILPDFQAPLHDVKAVQALQQFVKDYQPDELYCVGDEADMTEPARWSKGTFTEYAGTFQKGLDSAKEVMLGFREAVGDVPFHTMRSNHGDRLRHYISKYAPALASLRSLEYEEILGYRQAEIIYHDKIWEFTKGWALAHGDEANLIRTAGGTALSLARRIGLSVVCGHTHRAGIQHENTGVNGRINHRLVGMEVGHMMDLSKAGYLKTGGANWQQAFGIVYINNGVVTPNVVMVHNRQFTVEGTTYKW